MFLVGAINKWCNKRYAYILPIHWNAQFFPLTPETRFILEAVEGSLWYLKPPSKVPKETPIMIYDSIKTKPVQMSVKRHQSTVNPKIAELCKKYQADLEKPSYLLAGARDVLVYRASIAATSIMFGINMYFLYQLHKKFV